MFRFHSPKLTWLLRTTIIPFTNTNSHLERRSSVFFTANWQPVSDVLNAREFKTKMGHIDYNNRTKFYTIKYG